MTTIHQPHTGTVIRDENWAVIRDDPWLSPLRAAIYLQVLQDGPLTTRDIARRIERPLLTVRPRVTELLQSRWIRCAGRRGRSGLYEAVPVADIAAMLQDEARQRDPNDCPKCGFGLSAEWPDGLRICDDCDHEWFKAPNPEANSPADRCPSDPESPTAVPPGWPGCCGGSR